MGRDGRSGVAGTFLRSQGFLVVTALLAAAAVVGGLVPPREIPAVEDIRLLATLAALILSVELLRTSGALDAAVQRALRRFSRARSFTTALILASGALSAIVTNDVALFVVVPFTVAAARYSDFRVRNAVILEITAANLLGCLTPIGNPQNLFLFHRSGWGVGAFIGTMAPFCAASAVILGAAVVLLEPARTITRREEAPIPVRRIPAAAGTAGVVLVLLSIARIAPPWLPLAAIAPVAIVWLRGRWNFGSLSIVPLFFFVFIDIAALRAFHFDFFARLPLAPAPKLYLAGTLFSQAISNVPTAVLLASSAEGRWRLLLYAVNAGGCGTLIASLANLLGWQIYRNERGPDPEYLTRFYRVSFAFLAAVGVAAFLLA